MTILDGLDAAKIGAGDTVNVLSATITMIDPELL